MIRRFPGTQGNRVYRGPRGAMSGPHPDLYSRKPEPVRSPERWCGAGDGRGMEGAGNLLPEGKNYCFHRENDVYEEWAGGPVCPCRPAPAYPPSRVTFQGPTGSKRRIKKHTQ